jgi:hypothetical protein
VRSYTTVFAWFIGNLRKILVPRRGLELSVLLFNYSYLF